MSLQLTELKETQLIKDAPAIIWGNFTNVKNYLDRLEKSINGDSRSISLIDGLTTETGGISARSLQLKANGGNVISIQDDVQVRMSMDYLGNATMNSVVINASSETPSNFQILSVAKELIASKASFNGIVDFRGVDTKVQAKQTITTVVSSNIGASSVQKIPLATKGTRSFFDCNNNGVSLGTGGEALIALDVSGMLEGQEVEIVITRRNSDKIGFVNQKPTSTGTESLFATIGSNGFESMPTSATYKIDTATNGAFLKCVWTNIGSSTFRLLVLSSVGFNIE